MLNVTREKLVIGFIVYGKSTAKYLPYFLLSLEKQIFHNYKILVIDNSEQNSEDNIKYIRNSGLDIEIINQGKNFGFAKAHNIIIRHAKDLGAEYYLSINTDMILEPDAIVKMINVLDSDSKLGSVCPRIMQFYLTPQPPLLIRRGGEGGEVRKTNVIDSLGVQLKPGLRFIDLGQGQVDLGQFNNIKIIGPSGAAAMYRISAIEAIKEGDQYFDELMFMYKEDCDLAYRLYLAGFKAKCVIEAIVYHDRTIKAKGESNLQVAINRRKKSRQAKKWSFLNQQIIFVKYWHKQNFLHRLAIIWQQIKILIFIIIFEQYLLGQLKKLWQVRKQIQIYQ